ncbi:FAD-binding oxidoreductase [Anaeromyxobacter paludicola]|uniref:FAD-linked oxidase n=1 Tax=Anaeromyxobacter paludicola TaxID=2918171 RepID=A0ABM7XFV2_9BACT|nr:FAD-binding oxidoreductase [Anaeromyxobacter paludicola]BDG10745.1 FAD-linked oxidase [Anaeromyxobacter paludicola]
MIETSTSTETGRAAPDDGHGAAWRPDPETLATLRRELRGEVCLPGEPGYEQARTIWNAMIDRRPGAVIRAAAAADVVRAVELARDRGLRLSIRGGGHHIAGNAVCEGGLMLDLTPMKAVRIDAAARTARAEPGVVLGELDQAAQAHGLATPLGINSTTGIAGLTLGGGFGWLSRKHGLTVDNLLSADVVLATGEQVRASERENAELFWALRGGGGNFGVVTSFEYRLHPVGPQVLAGLVVHPFSSAKQVLRGYREAARRAPDDLTCWVVMRKAPPLPFLPPEVHGQEVLVLAVCYVGPPEGGEAAVAPFRALGQPIADVIGPAPFTAWQQAFDPLLTPGRRNYWKSHDLLDLGDASIELLTSSAGRLPSPECEVFVAQLGGAVNRVAPTATAYPHRDVAFVVNVHTRWGDPSEDRTCVGWARDLFARLAPYATGGVYVNFMPEDEAQRVSLGAYGPNYERLARLKARYDPENLFRQNQNIQPARVAADG